MDWDKIVKNAEQDQLLAAIVQMAHMARAYYAALVDEGFGKGEALTLTVSWQAAVMKIGMSKDGQP